MPGQPTPPRLVEAFALNAPNCSPAASVAGGKTVPFPTASEIGVVNGAASLHDGFPPLTFTPVTSGGVAPFGCDFNGILYIISSWAAFLGAGQLPGYDATLQSDMSGYALGATIAQSADPTATWTSNTSGNTTDPDTGGAGWISSKPLQHSYTSAGGAINDLALPGPSDYIFDVDCTAGATSITGLVAERDGQRVTLRKVDSSGNGLTLASLTGSAAGNQLQIVSPSIGLPLQYMSATIQYIASLTKWVQV